MVNRTVFIFLLLTVGALAFAGQNEPRLDLNQIMKVVSSRYKVNGLGKLKRDSYEQESIGASSLDNPVISYGMGRLKYNGGAGEADYKELSVTQAIPINGVKTSVRRQGRILGDLGEIEGRQSRLSLIKSALLAGVQFFVAKEKFKHVEERRKSFMLVSRFLKSRKFSSPTKQIEKELVESKLEEVNLETREVILALKASKRILELYVGSFDENSVDIKFHSSSQIKGITEKLSKKESLEAEKFSLKEKYFKIGVAATKRQWIPDLQVYYNESDEQFSGGNRNQVFGVGIEVPIFNVGKNKRKALIAQKSISKIEYEISKHTIQSSKKILLKNIQVSLDFLSTYDNKKLERKERLLKKFELDFKKGLVSAANFLDLEDNVHMIHNKKLESQLEVYKSLLGLIEISGDEQILLEVL